MKRLMVVMLLLAVAFAAFANGEKEKGAIGSSGALKDGSYFATYTTADNHGWQPFMRIEVAGGKIASVAYNYVSPDGKMFKTQDNQYNTTMLKFAGTNPEKAYPELEKRIISAQSGKIDAVTGATHSSETAMELASDLVSRAGTGNTADLVLPMTGMYTAEDKPDEHGGWIGHLEVTFGDQGKVTKVVYDEVKKENNKIVAYKSKDMEYEKNFKAKSGISQGEAYTRLSAELTATAKLNTVDAVTGATGTSERFNALVENIKMQRTGVAPSAIKAMLK